jgi:hypothetical protein
MPGYRFQRASVGSNRGPDGVCENDFVHCVSPPASQNREIGGCGALPDTRPSRHDGLGNAFQAARDQLGRGVLRVRGGRLRGAR